MTWGPSLIYHSISIFSATTVFVLSVHHPKQCVSVHVRLLACIHMGVMGNLIQLSLIINANSLRAQ